MLTLVGTVAVIHRVPLKSTPGENIREGEIGWAGLSGNRRWVVWDKVNKRVVTAKAKEGGPLLNCRSFHDGRASFIVMPDGSVWKCGTYPANRALSSLLGFEVELIRPQAYLKPMPTNYNFDLRPGMGVDSSPVQVVTTSSLEAAGVSLEEGVIRFSPTVVVKTQAGLGFVEDGWVRREMHIRPPGSESSSVELYTRKPTDRCPRPARVHGDLPARSLKPLHRKLVMPDGKTVSDKFLGLGAVVLSPGTIHIGDEVWVDLDE
jgi:uncharacterized protein YcbX